MRIDKDVTAAKDPIYTAKGDVAVGTASGTASALAVGANDTVLTADSAQTTGLKWAAAVLKSFFTQKGDLMTATAASTTSRLGVGSDGTVLRADSTASTGLAWVSDVALAEQDALPDGFTTNAGGFTTTPAIASTLSRTRNNIANQAGFLTSGTLYVASIGLRKGQTLTGAWFVNGNTSLVVGSGTTWHQWFVLLDSDGVTILRKTTDDGSGLWSLVTPKLLPFTSTYTPTHDGRHYIGVCVNVTGGSGSTMPNILGNSSFNANQLKVASNFTPPLLGIANTSLTDPASLVTVTARASWTDPAAIPWGGVY